MTEGTDQITPSETIESLRVILEREQSRPVPYKEALEVGESLITFFELLAEDNEPPE
jgi:hypothetical protein